MGTGGGCGVRFWVRRWGVSDPYHLPAEQVAAADAIVNPSQPGFVHSRAGGDWAARVGTLSYVFGEMVHWRLPQLRAEDGCFTPER